MLIAPDAPPDPAKPSRPGVAGPGGVVADAHMLGHGLRQCSAGPLMPWHRRGGVKVAALLPLLCPVGLELHPKLLLRCIVRRKLLRAARRLRVHKHLTRASVALHGRVISLRRPSVCGLGLRAKDGVSLLR